MGNKRCRQIYILRTGEVFDFAASELARYLSRLTAFDIGVASAPAYEPQKTEVLWLGLRSDFPGKGLQGKDPELDDVLYIDVTNGQGIIAGCNPRSLLLAVYRFLTEAGCRWVRPGPDGEYLPRIDLSTCSVHSEEAASYRHRGLCIEGAVSHEHVVSIIDWLPKVGLNAYYFQFREAYTFFERWYTHRHNPLKEGRKFSVEEAQAFVTHCEAELRKRGLLYHAVGHGWTCEPFGIPGLSWDQRVTEVKPETERYLALVNGKRQIWQQIPLNTNLCYSNPEVQQIMIEDIIAYIRKHPTIDYLHFWLADERDNQCECEACQQAMPSEFYVKMLNELDRRLTEESLTTHIVFLIYYDLLWPPVSERLANPDRFVLMFAPITRMYNESFGGREKLVQLAPDQPEAGLLQPYVRNRLNYPRSVGENLAHLSAWQRIFAGDAFDFDYHMMWAHYFDTGYHRLARIISEDLKNLGRFGLNGLISCQVQRAFLPTGLPMFVMARTLWNKELLFEDLVTDYFAAAFGPDGNKVARLMSVMPELLGELHIWAPAITPELSKKFSNSAQTISELAGLVAKNKSEDNPCWSASWKYLGLYLQIAEGLARLFVSRALGEQEQTRKAWLEIKKYIQEHEDELHTVFDPFEFIQTLEFMNKQLLNF